MAKTPKPLRILVSCDLAGQPWVQELAGKGHNVEETGMLGEYDLVLGPNAWRMFPELGKYVEDALKAARAVRYPKKEKVGAQE